MFDVGKEIGENPHLSTTLEWKTHRETECFTSPHHLSFPWEKAKAQLLAVSAAISTKFVIAKHNLANLQSFTFLKVSAAFDVLFLFSM